MTGADRIIREPPRRCIGREIVVVRPGIGEIESGQAGVFQRNFGA
jgi:hypothetical protein